MPAAQQQNTQDEIISALEQAESLPLADKVEAIRLALLMRAKRERDTHQSDWGYFGAKDGGNDHNA